MKYLNSRKKEAFDHLKAKPFVTITKLA